MISRDTVLAIRYLIVHTCNVSQIKHNVACEVLKCLITYETVLLGVIHKLPKPSPDRKGSHRMYATGITNSYDSTSIIFMDTVSPGERLSPYRKTHAKPQSQDESTYRCWLFYWVNSPRQIPVWKTNTYENHLIFLHTIKKATASSGCER